MDPGDRMEQGIFESYWTNVAATSEGLLAVLQRCASMGKALSVAESDGNLRELSAVASRLRDATKELDELLSQLASLEGPAGSGLDVMDEFEAQARNAFPNRPVWRSMGQLVIPPVRVVLQRDGTFMVGRTVVRSTKPSHLVGAVVSELRTAPRAESLAKSLYAAFRAANHDASTGKEQVRVLHKVLAASVPGVSGYPWAAFEADLQVLVSSGLTEVNDKIRISFVDLDVGGDAVSVYALNGQPKNYSHITFTQSNA